MLYQRTCCVILPRRIVVGRQFLGGLDFFVFVREGGGYFSFFLSTQTEVCCTEISVLQQHASNTKHFFFFPLFLFFLFSTSLPVGKIVGSFSAVQSEGNLIHSEFSSL